MVKENTMPKDLTSNGNHYKKLNNYIDSSKRKKSETPPLVNSNSQHNYPSPVRQEKKTQIPSWMEQKTNDYFKMKVDIDDKSTNSTK